jgi:hypothetical protein
LETSLAAVIYLLHHKIIASLKASFSSGKFFRNKYQQTAIINLEIREVVFRKPFSSTDILQE